LKLQGSLFAEMVFSNADDDTMAVGTKSTGLTRE
jgi:hypothetical protein